MKFATFTADGVQSYGAVLDDGIVNLSPDFPEWPSLRWVIAAGGLPRLATAAQGRPITHANGRFRWDIPVPDPEKIICVGVNYPDRNSEYLDGSQQPENMSLFVRFARSFVGHEADLVRPPETHKLDYEGELVVVIGTGGRRIPEAQALDHIAALSICNEGTLRDWVRHAKFNVTQGKNWDGSGAMGPWLVPYSQPGQVTEAELSTTVNGDVRQSDNTANMMFPVARQIAYISTFTTLVPGDVIVTGTPTGAGARLDPPVFLAPGDRIEVAISGLGTLSNGVRDE